MPETAPVPEGQTWDLIISPDRGWWDLRLREVWEHRQLIFLFFKRDFVSSYKQTLLGPFWFFAQPVATSFVYWGVFGRLGKIETKGVAQLLFFMAGVILWNFFSTSLLKTASVFTGNAGLFGKVYFPRLTVPLSIVLTNLMIFGVQFVIFLGFCVLAWVLGVPPHLDWRLLVLPFLLLEVAMLAIGTGCLVAACTVKYRDLVMAIQFGVQLWMFASCVVVPLHIFSPEMQRWIILNPMVPIIESFRYAFLGYGVIQLWQLLLSMAITTVIFAGGVLVFIRSERTHLDSI